MDTDEILNRIDLIEYGLYSLDSSYELHVIFKLVQEIRELIEGEYDV